MASEMVGHSADKVRSIMPSVIFCPRCGGKILLVPDTTPRAEEIKSWGGYDAVARGRCECGVVCAMLTKPMPESPSFTLQFNIYDFKSIVRPKTEDESGGRDL
jgi:hypothetical protein